jgi:hypothetical protein
MPSSNKTAPGLPDGLSGTQTKSPLGEKISDFIGTNGSQESSNVVRFGLLKTPVLTIKRANVRGILGNIDLNFPST